MGIVSDQTLKNTISTYIGFGIGAINTLFLFTKFLEDEYYGLVAFILSTANILMPLMAFGVQNTLVKFYSGYKTKNNQNSFLSLMLILPLFLIIPIVLITNVFYDSIAMLLSQKNAIIGDYIWYIVVTAIAMAYFEVFYAWSKIHMKTVLGNFLKEVFHRIAISVLLFCVFFSVIDVEEFIFSVVLVYVFRMILMLCYAFNLRFPVIRLKSLDNRAAIIKYASLIILAGSIAMVITDIDKFMIGQYLQIENVAYYSVAIYIATVIAVPQRSMHQILLPLTAKFLSDDNKIALADLYKRSSSTLFIIGGLIFLLIVLNINSLYRLLPPQYETAVYVVFIISIAKLFDNLMGNNNAILFNSDYYRMVLIFGILLTVLTVILNMIFIPKYGINGSAIATLMAVVFYNSIKLIFVYKKFKMCPINVATLKTFIILSLLVLIFYSWDFSLNPILAILMKSLMIVVVYVVSIYKLKLSEDINSALDKMLFFLR